jgi:flagellar hook-associated protein 3 FlgL
MIAANEQYSTNSNSALTSMTDTESTLQSISDILTSVQSIVTSASGTSSTDDLSTDADSVTQYIEELVNLANTKSNGKYIFGGTNTQDQPFTLSSDGESVTANASGITGTIEVPVADGIKQATNIDGDTALEGTSIFKTLISIRDSLASGSVPSTTDSDALTNEYSHVTGETAKAGLIINQLDNNATFLDTQKTQLQSLLSDQQDTDVATATTKMTTLETGLQTALTVTAKVFSLSLLNYL